MAHTKSAVTYMVVFQEAVSVSKIEQLCSSAPTNYGFTCDQVFSKMFKGFTTTVSRSSCNYCITCACVSTDRKRQLHTLHQASHLHLAEQEEEEEKAVVDFVQNEQQVSVSRCMSDWYGMHKAVKAWMQ